MPILVDQCKHYNGLTCSKCGRMLPDVCKDNADMEEKAAAYDLLMAQEASSEPTNESSEEPATTVTIDTKVPLPVARRGRK